MVPGIVTAVTRFGQVFLFVPGIITGRVFGGIRAGTKDVTAVAGPALGGSSSISMSMSMGSCRRILALAMEMAAGAGGNALSLTVAFTCIMERFCLSCAWGFRLASGDSETRLAVVPCRGGDRGTSSVDVTVTCELTVTSSISSSVVPGRF